MIKTETSDLEGRDKCVLSKSRQAELQSQSESKLVDENEQMYGIGYLNPVFDYNQHKQVTTPESSPIEVPHRSRKSSAKADKLKGTVIDVSRTVRRRLDMSSIPDVVQTSQLQTSQSEESSSDSSEGDAHIMDEEFFLTKNSKLFSQVSTNTLKPTEGRHSSDSFIQPNSFRVVEVKEMEIVKSVASAKDRVVLPRANVSVEHVPQVVERVEILEDPETEPESADTDVDEKENRSKIPISKYYSASAIHIKRGIASKLRKDVATPAFRLDIESEKSNVIAKPSTSLTPRLSSEFRILNKSSKKQNATGAFLKERVDECLLLDQSKEPFSFNGAKKKVPGKSNGTKEVKFKRDKDIARRSFPKRIGSLSPDDAMEDCESFYGSDKETDDVLIFSDDTEVDVGSSSSEGESTNLDEHVEHLLDKVMRKAFYLHEYNIF